MTKKIVMSEAKAQAILVNQSKKFFAIQQSIEFSQSDNLNHAYWLVMIRDLIEGAGYNYSRIATCVDACPSTIQKLITHPGRRPRIHLLEKLLILYHKVFHGPYITQRVQNYLTRRPIDVLNQLPQEWVNNIVSKNAQRA